MEGRHVWALYLVKSRRGLGGSAPNLRWGASVGGAVRQNPYDHSVTNVQSKYDHAMVSTLVISQLPMKMMMIMMILSLPAVQTAPTLLRSE